LGRGGEYVDGPTKELIGEALRRAAEAERLRRREEEGETC
jgi:hypothetical protein